jgi:tetratricopeptide (TPR) repeat protein
MFGWFKAKSPLTADQRTWIDTRFQWLREQFGEARLKGTVVLPTDEFFPDRYQGTQADAEKLFQRLCGLMEVDPARVELTFYKSPSADDVVTAFNPELSQTYALGAYDEQERRTTIWLEQTRLDEPMSVVATLAHELGHVHLLGDGRCSSEVEDHEPLTDLLTVYFGLGIFSANSALREVNWRHGNWSGWNMQNQGYLSSAQYAYALAVYAYARGEQAPAWKRHLRADVRSWFAVELKDLVRGVRPAAEPPSSDDESTEEDASEQPAIEPDLDEDDSAHFEEAEDTEHEFIVPVKGQADVAFSRGVVYDSEGQYERAVECYSEALRLKSKDAEAWLHRAESYRNLNRFAEAVEDSSRALQYEPNDPSALHCRGLANVWLGNFSAAIADGTNALKEDSKDPTAYLIRGLAQLGLASHENAVADLTKSIRYAPTWALTYLARSLAYEALGKTRHAQGDIYDAIRHDETLKDEEARNAYLPESIRNAGTRKP